MLYCLISMYALGHWICCARPCIEYSWIFVFSEVMDN